MRWTRTTAATGLEPDRADPGLLVEPTRLGGSRSSAGMVVAVAIVAALALAIAKPWAPPTAGGPPDDAIGAGPSAQPGAIAGRGDVGRPEATPMATPAGGGPAGGRTLRVADWPELAHDADHLGGQPIVTDLDLGGTDGDGTCGGSARITPFDELIGIVVPPGERVADVRLFAIDSIRRPDVATRIWVDRPGPLDGRALGGITVVALPSGGIAARQYALIAETTSGNGPSRLIYTICVA
jgi:hypothetical protein